MVHVRLNERETNPNPHINFITALPIRDAVAEEDARQLLRALAAQVKPVMKAHGLVVNSLEEYEYNKVFLGRNWNSGETVELVLRGAQGEFQPLSWLLNTLCHELAHNKHSNHGPAFQALCVQLRREVRELQSKGYYGDGYWSSGQRLADSSRVGGQALTADPPEYMCGGAQSRARPSSLRRRRHRHHILDGPSNHTGRQTTKKRKAGSRVTAKGTFEGGGRALNEDVEDEGVKKAGAGFRKQAGSKKAKEARAIAAERRLLALQAAKPGQSSIPTTHTGPDSILDSGSESDNDNEESFKPETDQDRRRILLESDANAGKLRQTSLDDFADDFLFPSSTTHAEDDVLIVDRYGATTTSGPSSSSNTDTKGKGKASAHASTPAPSSVKRRRREATGREQASTKSLIDFFTSESSFTGRNVEDDVEDLPPKKAQKMNSLAYGGIVQDEMSYRKKESLGMQPGSSRTLGAGRTEQTTGRSKLLDLVPVRQDEQAIPSRSTPDKWPCIVCTLSNEPGHLACSACGTPRGKSQWQGNLL